MSAADVEALDTLKVSDLVYNFRCHGHLAALLDPLQRVKHGPWRSDVITQRSATLQCWVGYAVWTEKATHLPAMLRSLSS